MGDLSSETEVSSKVFLLQGELDVITSADEVEGGYVFSTVCLFVCLFVCPFVCLFVCLFVDPLALTVLEISR